MCSAKERRPSVYNRRHSDVPEDAVDISRTSPWGNPFRITAGRDRAAVIQQYRDWIIESGRVGEVQRELRGHDLLCWCKPKPCHGDVLLEIANLDPLI